MAAVYHNTVKKNSKKLPISDYLFSFDIETTSWTENIATMYSWCLGAADYSNIVTCKCNEDLEKITDIINGRTWNEFDDILYELNGVAVFMETRYIIIIYNFDFEWSYMQKNIDFIRYGYIEKFPTVLEGRHNIMGICAGNLIFLDARRLFGLGSLKQNAEKYGFEKYEYEYEIKRHSNTELTESEIRYNTNDVLITLGCWAKKLYDNGYEHLCNAPYTATSLIKDLLRKNENVNKIIGYNEIRNKRKNKYLTIKKPVTLFDNAVEIASSVFPDNVELNTMADRLEKAFSGGYSHCNIFIQNKLLYNVFSADLGSAYPGAMQAAWYPRKLLKSKNPNLDLYKMIKRLREKYDSYMKLAKATRERLDEFAVVLVELKNVSAKVYTNSLGKVNIPIISRHKILEFDNDSLFDNGKLVESKRIKIMCTTIDLLIWDYCYNYKIAYCYECYLGMDIQKLPEYWLNAVDYTYQAKTILKNTVHKYTENSNWESEYRKLPGIDDTEINHVKSMDYHEALYYLNMVLMQRKAELNGLYGIMVMHIIRQSYVYTDNKEVEKGKIDIRKAKDGTCYLWGIIVTAIVRLWEVTFSLYLTDNDILPCYWDTDSVKSYFKSGIDVSKIINNFNEYVGCFKQNYPKLGAYDYEGTYYAFKSLGAKRYIVCELNNKTKQYEWESTIAGLPKKVFSGFLTQELNSALEHFQLKDAVSITAEYFRPNVFIDESATSKLIPKYINTDIPVTMDLIDYKGVHSTETFWPGARLTGIQFAIMDMKILDNKFYQNLCNRIQGAFDDEYNPIIIFYKNGKYDTVDGRLDIPDYKVYMMQKDASIYM